MDCRYSIAIKCLMPRCELRLTSFERQGKGTVTFSHCQHDKAETRSVSRNENLQPLDELKQIIVDNRSRMNYTFNALIPTTKNAEGTLSFKLQGSIKAQC